MIRPPLIPILTPLFRYVLNADEYDDSIFQGPPRNLPRDEVFNLFGESRPDPPTNPCDGCRR